MSRGAQLTRVHYEGTNDDYYVLLDNVDDYKKWLTDKSVPLAEVVSSFKIFCKHKRGNQGMYDAASNADLDNEFGTHVDSEVIDKILRQGVLAEGQIAERHVSKNDVNGGWATGLGPQGTHQ
ncbi:ribosome maturation protein [Coniochaeta sp. 2T2.1]|nr:ribosome maturation protein [Coniochaeta sp. 2T2.1]